MNIYTPYTYLIGWSRYDIWYYGMRYGKTWKCLYENGCHPDDLWKTYFTSSNQVRMFREKHGEPDIIQIRKTFKTDDDAISWESRVLTRLKIKENNKWLNQHDGNKHFRLTEETRRKIGEKSKGRQSKLGYETPESTKKKISESVKKTFEEKDYRKDFRHTYKIVFPSGETIMTDNIKHFCEQYPDAPSPGTIRQQLHRGKNVWSKSGPYKGFEIYDLTK